MTSWWYTAHKALASQITYNLPAVSMACLGKQVNQLRYRKTSSISRTKSQNLYVSNLVMQLSLLNPLKPGVKSRMKM